MEIMLQGSYETSINLDGTYETWINLAGSVEAVTYSADLYFIDATSTENDWNWILTEASAYLQQE
jgi:hypothetical protein